MSDKILIVVTNQDHYAGYKTPTGLWLSELVHFWDVMEEADYSMDLVSPHGGKSPLEPRSLSPMMLDKASRTRYEDKIFMQRLEETLPAGEVNWRDYVAIYYTGGHGVMYDFHENEDLQAINRNLYENGRVVVAVCHGYCGLLNTKLSNGDYLVKGKTITGYSWFEERLANVAKKVPYNVQAEMEARGANYQKALLPFVPFVKANGNLITGQNPASATKTAQLVLKVLQTNK